MSTPRFLLTADELHFVQDHVPTLRLPPRFRQEWASELGPAEAVERVRAALASLIAKGLVAADVPRDPIPANLSDWLLEPFMVFLSLHMAPAWVFEVSAWTRESTLLLVASARGGFGSLLARAQNVEIADGRGTTGDLAGVEFAVVPFPDLAGELALAIPRGGEAGDNGPIVTMSLTDSRGGIEVLRARDPLLLEELSHRIGGPGAVQALSGLAGDLNAGFELRLSREDGIPVRVLRYVRGAAGWRSVDVRVPAGDDGLPTAEQVVDSGTITIAAVTYTAIRAEVASLCAEITLKEMAHE
ncbi:hypothetical protein E3T39_15815 [Cryobacterium suzukii]|uniref:ESX secretion-associated protein EspG n=1 Tax=Cryobacterium suzukii TaxID=1259198 RepID=A0A4R9AC36_9MICO|nr:hypothetical protein [Cryobacterium suzukii]TFD56795.1 hypothetical protein E3T39_15815 [Cryobacterium suzukii]